MKALIIEDDQVIAEFVKKGLNQAGFTVEIAADGLQGLHLALNESYDVAIVDLMLPELGGLDVIDRVRAESIDLPIIILSAKRSVDERIVGLRKGGDDYLTKPFSFSELMARIQAVMRRYGSNATTSKLSIGDLSLDLLSRKVTRAEQRIFLQPKEFALLEYLIRNSNHVVSKTMIMERVWDYHFDPGTNVVEARISKLREKIDKGFTRPLIHTVRGVGYVLRDSIE